MSVTAHKTGVGGVDVKAYGSQKQKNGVTAITDVYGPMNSMAVVKAAAIAMIRRRPIYSAKTKTAPNATNTAPI